MDNIADRKVGFGVVAISGGIHKGRIGFYDEDETEKTAIVYFWDMFLADRFYFVPRKF